MIAAAASVSRAGAQSSNDHEFEFERTKIGKFELSAKTEVDRRDSVPFIGDTRCSGDNDDISFVVGKTAQLQWLKFAFYGPFESDGNRSQLTLTGDALWLFVDGRRYEYRNVSRERSDRFSNYRYLPDPAANNGIVLSDWHGYRAVRASTSDPFTNMSMIYGDVVRAKTLAWAFKSRNWKQVDRSVPGNALPNGWQGRRYRIDNRDLKAAVDWCAKMVASEKARQLPPQFISEDR